MADPFLDSLGIKSGNALDAAPKAKPRTYAPEDLAVRLAILEDRKSAEGQAAVAGTMANRAKANKGDLLGALTAPNAYEPWKTKQDELAAIDPNSPEYKAAAAVVLPVLQGKVANPVGEAINFYSPESQAALAGDGKHPAKPDFDDGKGVRIGGNLFFGVPAAGDTPSAGGGDTFLTSLGVDPSKPAAGFADADLTGGGPATIKVVNGKIVDGATGKPVPEAQVKVLQALQASGRLKDDGTIDGHVVHMQRDPGDTFAPGDFYISAPDKGLTELEAQVAGQKPRAAAEPKLMGGPQTDSFGGGAAQGVQDVGLTLTRGLEHVPGLQGSGVTNFLQSQQQIYDATHPHGMTASGFGRFTGQLAASAPIMAGGEVLIAPRLAQLGAAGRFLAGEGGQIATNAGLKMAPGVGGLATRAGSLAARGAAEGAGGAALVSSASDEPLGEQLLLGAGGGAVFGPALHGLIGAGVNTGRTINRFLEPFTERGAGKAADRTIQQIASYGESQPMDLTVHIPGAPGPTLAEATANPALAQLQRNLAQDYRVNSVFEGHDGANNRARQAVTLDAQGDPATVADLARGRALLVDAHRAHVFSGAGEADAAPVVSLIDSALTSPEALHPDVAPVLGKVRGGLVTEPDTAHTPAEAAAFMRKAGETFGADGDAWTPDVMDAAKGRLGAKFNEIAGKTDMAWDDPLRHDIGEAIKTAAEVVPDVNLPPLFKRLDEIASTAQQKSEAMGLGHVESTPATISGASYQELTRSGGALDTLMKDNGSVGVAARKIRAALDDALERSVEAKGAARGVHEDTGLPLNEDGTVTVYHHTSPEAAAKIRESGYLTSAGEPDVYVTSRREPDTGYGPESVPVRVKPEQLHLDDEFPDGRRDFRMDAGGPGGSVPVHIGEAPNPVDELRGARLQYKNLKTAEAALRSAGPDGVVTPKQLFAAVRQNFGSYAYKGGGPLGDVATDAIRALEGKTATFEKDPAKLYAHRENLSAAIAKLSKADETDDAARQAAAKLTEVRDAMDAALDASTPGYAEYRRIADNSAEPIEAQRYLQSLPLKTSGKDDGKVTLHLVNRALERIDKARSLPGKHPAKAITEPTLQQLRALQADLNREANRTNGLAKGSPTHQLASSAVQQVADGVPAALAVNLASRIPLVGGQAARTVGNATDRANERVLHALASRMLNPGEVVLNPPPVQPSRFSEYVRRVGGVVPGVTGGLLASRLLGN